MTHPYSRAFRKALALTVALYYFLRQTTQGFDAPRRFWFTWNSPTLRTQQSQHPRMLVHRKSKTTRLRHKLPRLVCLATLSESLENTEEEENNDDSSANPPRPRSQIRCIKASNLGGFVSHNQDTVVVTFQPESKFVAVTGNSASGKSLLMAKTIDLLCGAKATASLVRGSSATVEIQLFLEEPHLSVVKQAFHSLGLDAKSLVRDKELILQRTMALSAAATSLDNSSSRRRTTRLKSSCRVNGQAITLKDMTAISQPLLVVVDAATAAAALAKEDARLQMIDAGVSNVLLQSYHIARRKYKTCRQHREQLQNDLARSSTSKLYSDADGERDLELLKHYIGELDALEARAKTFCESLLHDTDASPESCAGLAAACHKLAKTSWNDNLSATASGQAFRSALFERLLSLRDNTMRLDEQLKSAMQVAGEVGSLSTQQSAMTAIHQARKKLFDATGRHRNGKDRSMIDAAAEQVHDMLTGIEAALEDCVKFIEDDDRGLVTALELERSCCAVSTDHINALIGDWSSLARKHGVTSHQLPSCHVQLKDQVNGNVMARQLLPNAIADEDEAFKRFEIANEELLNMRCQIAAELAKDATAFLPSLSMDNAELHIDIKPCRLLTDSSVTTGAEYTVSFDFMLVDEQGKSGHVHEVASSGEKARVLLALESSLSGSVGALRRASSNAAFVVDSGQTPPIAVVYDEIDAHVGGSAANTLATMLAEQSNSAQIIAITHSPPVGALADLHLVFKRTMSAGINGSDPRAIVVVDQLEGNERRLELARMASGDLASAEAQTFAEALIREGALRREQIR